MEELATLAAEGASALVALMVTDSWERVKGRVAAFLSRGRQEDAGSAEEELDLSQGELVNARDEGDEEAADDLQATWRSRLRRVLREDPAAADELRALLEEVRPQLPAQDNSQVHNSVGVVHSGAQVYQGRDFSHLTIRPPGV
ncbi:hypothetical protein [Streptomyces sp. NPDC005438]|uniref:hypothetical protein n=1 Tax=Streptomyces sp. NPDC005438 TaxID=3156880 RepID=UPI0033B45370